MWRTGAATACSFLADRRNGRAIVSRPY